MTLAADLFDTSSLSFVRRASRDEAPCSMEHCLAVADAAFDASAADVAALYGVARPAAVIARTVREFSAVAS